MTNNRPIWKRSTTTASSRNPAPGSGGWIVISRDDDPDMAWKAWACLYERHVRYLYGVVLKRAQDVFRVSDAAEDLVRATFIKAFERAHTFKSPEEPLDDEGKSKKSPVVRPALPQPLDDQVKENLGRAARDGKTITESTEEKMRKDREEKERERDAGQ